MRILVDENIPLGPALFGALGEVVSVPGRSVDEAFPSLETFDVLAIRSVTRVTPALVDRAERCRVIATATIGTDHIDTPYVERANRRREHPITVISAPGSNAESVADHVWFALAAVAQSRGLGLHGRSLGVVGCGNCGSRVVRRAQGFDMRVVRCDPPLAERAPAFESAPLEEALAADFVTLHVPLTRPGESSRPTHHMVGRPQLDLVGPHAWLLNTSRGPVVDSPALVEALRERRIGGAVLDVFEGEPEPPEDLITLAELATPHIAGYAIEAKRRGAVVVYEATCRALGVEPVDTRGLLSAGLEAPAGQQVSFDAGGPVEDAADRAFQALARAAWDIGATSRALKATVGRPGRGAAFDAMRRDYERDYARHELAAYAVRLGGLSRDLEAAVARRLEGFGVVVTRGEAHYELVARR